ncbi:GIY-YIG nuclease family protein [Patescibacteria group bacterium]
MHYVYLLRCLDNSLYCGVSNDPEKRLREHNFSKTKASRYTRTRRPVKIVYLEKQKDLKSALQREHQIKSWSKSKKEALVSGYHD